MSSYNFFDCFRFQNFSIANFLTIIVPDEGNSRNCVVHTKFYNYHWVDGSAGGLFVPEGIIHPVVSASALTWFI
jgi:hypothetical protein